MRTFANGNLLPLWIILALLVLFGTMIAVIIFVKRKTNKIGVNEEEKVDEQTAVQQELDRILVPIDDDIVEKDMNGMVEGEIKNQFSDKDE